MILASASERLTALMEMLRVFYSDPLGQESQQALAAFNKSVTPMTEGGHAELMQLAGMFAESFDAMFGIDEISGAEDNLREQWLLGIRLGVEIGMATMRESEN
ncbi:hypothetical protein LCGC14_2538430 [marine sediment metagenome]|uniref:Uncharacterized protein n=1 Tax=marine sediment metagenome TaxID=412755 RepID=A0A0F9DJH7_9ZZZZ